jgi:hypothetical protein
MKFRVCRAREEGVAAGQTVPEHKRDLSVPLFVLLAPPNRLNTWCPRTQEMLAVVVLLYEIAREGVSLTRIGVPSLERDLD